MSSIQYPAAPALVTSIFNRRHRTWIAALATVVVVALQGCATPLERSKNSTTENEDRFSQSDLSKFGTTPVTEIELETIDLDRLLDPTDRAQEQWRQRTGKSATAWSELNPAVRYDLAFEAFNGGLGATDLIRRRNGVQSRLLTASDRRCGRYSQFLKKKQSDRNFQFGVASSVFSTLGALVPGLRGAQNLSGLSALTSGVRAEYNQDYFANLTASVITRGIEEKRKVAMEDIARRRGEAYDNYSVQQAVEDAVRYDSMCNIVAGLEKANDSLLEQGREPGIEQLARATLKAQMLRNISQQDFSKLRDDLKNLDDAGVNTKTLKEELVSPLRSNSGLTALSRNGGGVEYSAEATPMVMLVRDDMLRSISSAQRDIAFVATGSYVATASTTAILSALTATMSALTAATTTSVIGSYTMACTTKAKILDKAMLDAIFELGNFRATHDSVTLSSADGAALAAKEHAKLIAAEDIANFGSRLQTYKVALSNALKPYIEEAKASIDRVRTSKELPAPGNDAYAKALTAALDDKSKPLSAVILKNVPAKAACDAPEKAS